MQRTGRFNCFTEWNNLKVDYKSITHCESIELVSSETSESQMAFEAFWNDGGRRFSPSSQQMSVKLECWSKEETLEGGGGTCAASCLWSPSSHPGKSSEGHEPKTMTHGSCVCNPAHAEKLKKKQGKEKSNRNNKGRAMALPICKHNSAILSLSLPLKNTDTGWEVTSGEWLERAGL